MSVKYTDFLMQNCFNENFFNINQKDFVLEEKESSGRSKLKVKCLSRDNIIIENLDDKKTQLNFFRETNSKGEEMHLYKRVDHIIFEHVEDSNWKLHLIEMKSSVSETKWIEIKGKFRASYLLAMAIAAMLKMEISETKMYTTYEKVSFKATRLKVGGQHISPKSEWTGNKFGLNFGERLPFIHIPIQMTRDTVTNILEGSYTL